MADKPLDIFEDSPESEAESHNHDPYPLSVKFGVVLLSALAVVLVFWQMKRNLVLDIPQFGSGTSVERSLGILQQEDEQLRIQDSDLDGLSDYEELKVYGTSPFIADTDSDGISDADEVKAGTDPNCPAGKNCFGILSQSETKITAPSFADNPEIQALLDNPEELRKLLIESGLDPLQVELADDQSLQILAQQALTQITELTPEKEAVLGQLTVTQLRALYIEYGADPAELDKITDEEILSLFAEGLAEVKSNVTQ